MKCALLLGALAAGCGFDSPLLIENGPAAAGAGGNAGLGGTAGVGGTAGDGGATPIGGTGGSAGSVSDAATDAPIAPDASVPENLVFAVGEYSACAIVHGTTYCWGAKTDWGTDFRPAPVRVDVPEALVQIAAGRAHACGISGSGAVYCWGDNATAQLGSRDPASSGPIRVGLPAPAKKITCGSGHNCAILEDSTLWCWGNNSESQLGTAELDLGPIVATPTQVGIASDYLDASGGDGHSCALRAPGALYCWGRNSAAQLGLGTRVPGQAVTPLRVGTDTDWVAISSAQEGSCGKKRDGRLVCWGNDLEGRIGAGGGLVLSPVPIGDALYTSVATSTFHTCGVRADKSLFCQGRNVEGQLAAGNFDPVLGMTRALGTGSLEVGVGRFHTCVRDENEHLLCAGKNDVGQLGLGDTQRRAQLTLVPLGY